MIGGLIVTHGKLARELLIAAETIEDGEHRKVEGLYAVELEWGGSVEQTRDRIAQALERLSGYQGVIIFTDMFGGTASNISLSFLDQGRVEIVTGVNLPMIIKFVSVMGQSGDVRSVAHLIREKGSKSIRVASDLLGDGTGEQGS